MSAPLDRRSGTYVLMTAAHNEEAFIEGTIRSVLSQTRRPERWVIVSDNSTDRTDEIIESYARQHDFIRFLPFRREPGRNFGAKVIALHKGCKLLEDAEYDFIGNLDADITLEASYFENLLGQFQRNPRLGLVGGFVYEDSGSGFRGRRVNDVRNVAHAAQLVRRECYEAIGGYAVLKYGGEDWYAQTGARMIGWEVEALPQMKIFHHRHTGTSSSPIKNAFRLGKLDYSFGSYPVFEVMKCLRRIRDWPYFVITLSRLAGFTWPYLSGERREVPADFASFLRQEQRQRLSSVLKRIRPVRPVIISGPSTDGTTPTR
jgi:glycosyltransferase involved in cell wall biosynthesis